MNTGVSSRLPSRVVVPFLASQARCRGFLYSLDVEDASLLHLATLGHDPDGEPYLACKGREAKFAPKVQPPPTATNGTRTDLDRALSLYGSDGWLDVRRTHGRIEIRRGKRAKALREGRPS